MGREKERWRWGKKGIYILVWEGWVAVRWAELLRSEAPPPPPPPPWSDIADVVVREFVALATNAVAIVVVRACFDLPGRWRRSPPEEVAEASAACRSRRFAAGTQVLFKWVLHSNPRLLQHVRHRWYEQSFFAWFPHSWHADDPVVVVIVGPVVTAPAAAGTTTSCCCCCNPVSFAFPPPAPHSSSADGSWFPPHPSHHHPKQREKSDLESKTLWKNSLLVKESQNACHPNTNKNENSKPKAPKSSKPLIRNRSTNRSKVDELSQFTKLQKNSFSIPKFLQASQPASQSINQSRSRSFHNLQKPRNTYKIPGVYTYIHSLQEKEASKNKGVSSSSMP